MAQEQPRWRALSRAADSISFEIDPAFRAFHREEITSSRFLDVAKGIPNSRLIDHQRFVDDLSAGSRSPKYRNSYYGFPVVTRQEMGIIIGSLAKVVQIDEGEYVARHDEIPSSLHHSRYIRENLDILEFSWCSRRLQSRAEELYISMLCLSSVAISCPVSYGKHLQRIS